jgi:hypothetical protein
MKNRCFAKGHQQASVTVRRCGGRRALVAHRAAGACRQLPARRLGAAEHGRDLGKRGVEHIVQQEGRALRR